MTIGIDTDMADYVLRKSGLMVPRRGSLLPRDGKVLTKGFRPSMLNARDRDQYEHFKALNLHRPGVAHISGQPRSGKTTWAVFFAWVRRKLWGNPVVSNILLKPEFGEYTYLPTKRLVAEFRKVNKAIEDAVAQGEEKFDNREHSKLMTGQMAEVAKRAWASAGTVLQNATIIFDEGYGAVDRRRTQSPKHMLITYLIQTFGHFGCFLALISSSEKLLDAQRVIPFLTHQVKCSHISEVAISQYIVLWKFGALIEETNPWRHNIYIPNWGGRMFDSEAPVAVDNSLLRRVLENEGVDDEEEEDRKIQAQVRREQKLKGARGTPRDEEE